MTILILKFNQYKNAIEANFGNFKKLFFVSFFVLVWFCFVFFSK